MAKGAALITGASSGIGAELAKLCAADGYPLVLVARSADRLKGLAESLAATHNIAARALAADLADAAAPQAIFEQTRSDQVEILINNAGFGLRGPFAETDWSRECSLIQVNITALAHLTKLFLPEMLRRQRGRILNVGSTAAYVPGPFMAAYYASKAFVRAFSESVADEVRGSGVSVTLLSPGPTRTQFFDAAGIGDSKLVQGAQMDASAVARIGYDAMMAGKIEVISGARNRLMMFGSRLTPRTMLAGIARRLNNS